VEKPRVRGPHFTNQQPVISTQLHFTDERVKAATDIIIK